MRTFRLMAGAALILALPLAARAQTTSTTTTTTNNQTVQYDDDDYEGGQWLASAFVGSNFGSDADERSLDFGGSVGYLWSGAIGLEFQANITPEFNLDPARSALLLGETPAVHSYMFNAIGAIPVGDDIRWQPYLSGGLGMLALRADVLDDPDNADIEPDDSRFGGNVGAGVMAFFGNAGLRADLRYFRGFDAEQSGDEVGSPTEAVGNRILSNLSFWRANIGVAFRW